MPIVLQELAHSTAIQLLRDAWVVDSYKAVLADTRICSFQLLRLGFRATRCSGCPPLKATIRSPAQSVTFIAKNEECGTYNIDREEMVRVLGPPGDLRLYGIFVPFRVA